jgi:putative endonuclease
MTGFVYIMANQKNGTIYVGVTSDLVKRAYEHREGLIGGFTRRFGCKVWFEAFDDLQEARKPSSG